MQRTQVGKKFARFTYLHLETNRAVNALEARSARPLGALGKFPTRHVKRKKNRASTHSADLDDFDGVWWSESPAIVSLVLVKLQ